MALSNGSSGYQYSCGNVNEVLLGNQAAEVSKSAAATLTASELTNGILACSGTSGFTLTLPAASDLDVSTSSYSAPVASARANSSFDFRVINATAGAGGSVVLSPPSSWNTSVGSLTVTVGTSAGFRCRKVSDGSWTLYRIS